MKNYFTLAALLGAVAFVSVSYLAQANEPEMAAPAVAVEAPVDADAALKAECTDMLSADGTTRTAEELTAAVDACVAGKKAEGMDDAEMHEEGEAHEAPTE